MDKKDGNGSHNWGTFEDEIKAEDDKANVSASDESPAENTEQKEKTEGEVTELDAEAEAKKAAEEEEARTMTLDEWKAQQAGAKEDKPKFNVRKAGEGSDLDPKWKKTYAYKKEKETHEDDEDDVSCSHDCLFLKKRNIVKLNQFKKKFNFTFFCSVRLFWHTSFYDDKKIGTPEIL